jgi:hypothetical protein
MIGSLTRWVLRHRQVVVVVWLSLTIGGIAAAGSTSEAAVRGIARTGRPDPCRTLDA